MTFTATPTNQGTAPTYLWKKGSTTVGTNSATYTDATLANGDVITCVMTPSAEICASPITVTSNAITMTVTQPTVPTCDLAVNINPSQAEVCQNATLSLTAQTGSQNPQSQPNTGGQARQAIPMRTYRWLSPQGAGLNSTSSEEVMASFTSSGVKTFTVIVTDGDNCTATSTVNVTVKPLPTVTLVFPDVATVVGTGIPTITVPMGTGLSYQVLGG